MLVALTMLALIAPQTAHAAGSDSPQYRITLSDKHAVVSAQSHTSESVGLGFVLSDDRQSWKKSQLTDGPRGIGYAVARDGDYAIIGAPWHNGFAGAGYIYRWDNGSWQPVQTLTPPDLGSYDHLGGAVDIQGNTAVVAASWQALIEGAVYVYERTGNEWTLAAKLTASDRQPDTHFGSSIRIDGDRIVVGTADISDPQAIEFVRAGDSWVEATKVPSTDLAASVPIGETVIESNLLDLALSLRNESAPEPIPMAAAPSPVTAVSASDAVFEDRVVIEWKRTGDAAILYRLERDGSLIFVGSSDDSMYTDFDGTLGVQHNYCIIVDDLLGGLSAPTCDLGQRIINAPANFKGTGYFADFIRLTWTDLSTVETEYQIRRGGALIATVPANTQVFDDSTAVPGSAYGYTLVAADSNGATSASVAASGYRSYAQAPLDLEVSVGIYPDYVELIWTDIADNEVGYIINRDEGNIDSIPGSPGTGSIMTYRDSTAVPGQLYGYAVGPIISSGEFAFPPTIEFGGIGVLPKPENVNASDTTYDDRVEVTWAAPFIPVSGLEDAFIIERDGTVLDTVPADTFAYRDFTASPGTVYNYCVRSLHELGETSVAACDNGQAAIILAPTNVQATDDEFEHKVKITWDSDANNAGFFYVYRDGVVIKTAGSNIRFYEDFKATAGVTHAYSVSAVTGSLVESMSLPDSGRRSLNAPGTVSASDDEEEDRILLTWADNSLHEDGYMIERTSPSTTLTTFYTSQNQTSYTDFTAIPGEISTYTVYAFDSAGGTLGTSEGVTDPGRRTLKAPTNVNAADGDSETEVLITWEDQSGAEEGYYIFRNGTKIDSTSDNATKYTDLSPIFGAQSEYGIAAFDLYGTSDTTSDTGSTILLPPLSVNASDSYDDRVEIAWVDVSDLETDYYIYRNGALIDSVGANMGYYTDNSAAAGTKYEYCVRTASNGSTSEAVCDSGGRLVFSDVYEPYPIEELEIEYGGNDAGGSHRFGYSVSVDGDQAIIGAPQINADAGAAYIYEKQQDGTWAQVQMLTASDPFTNSGFGFSVCIKGDRAIVGAPLKNNGSGNAYIFEKSGGVWSEVQRLQATDGWRSTNDNLGWSVAIEGNVAAVGVPDDGHTQFETTEPGQVYLWFRSGTWPVNENQRIRSSDGQDIDEFGWAVALEGDKLIVGAPYDDNGNGNDAGAIYIFEKSGSWPTTETQKVVASDGTADDHFGYSVDIDANVFATGAENFAAAYVFERELSGWTETDKVVRENNDPTKLFGTSIGIDGSSLIVGAPSDNSNTGAAYLFYRIGNRQWTVGKKLVARDGAAADAFGTAVAISNGTALIGAPEDDDFGGGSGAVYFQGATTLQASDGTLPTRVRVEWVYPLSNPDGFNLYRDDELIATLDGTATSYDDTDAQPGRTYTYSLAAVDQQSGEGQRQSDIGWRPANGSITGRIATPLGAGVENISVTLDPLPIKSVLFDGGGGLIRIPDYDGNLKFGTDKDFTIETWIRFSGDGGTSSDDVVIFGKCDVGGAGFVLKNGLGGAEPGRLIFQLSNGSGFVAAATSSTDLNDNEWHHVACVHSAQPNLIVIVVDGALDGTPAPYGAFNGFGSDADLTIGGGIDPENSLSSAFAGQIDEFRVWDVVRGTPDIMMDRNRKLLGDESGLVAYYPLDGGNPKVVTDLTGNGNYGQIIDGAYFADDAAPIDITATTDSEGNYSLNRIFYGQETTFEVIPFDGDRTFSPAFKSITLAVEQPVENQVDFQETSLFTMSGLVSFSGTSCGAQEVQMEVDGVLNTLTDKNGKFNIATTYGGHWIKPARDGRRFSPDSAFFDVTGDLPGIVFEDTTTHSLRGLIGGGCRTPIGDVLVRVRTENACFDSTFRYDTDLFSAYNLTLPPQRYIVTADIDLGTVPSGLDPVDISKFFENLGDQIVNLSDSAQTLDLVYRAPIVVQIEGLGQFVGSCSNGLTFNGQPLPDSLPIVPQGTHWVATIKVNEDYGSGNLCPLDSGVATIYDEIFDQQDSPKSIIIKNGVGVCSSFASTPSLIAGRVDTEGNNRSYQKSFQAVVDVPGRNAASSTEWALVTGHVAPEGSDFVTASSTDFLSYILRDPPGDESYAYLEKGSELRTRIAYEKFDLKSQTGVAVEARFGLQLETWVGIGGGTATEITAKKGFAFQSLNGLVRNVERATDVILTTTEEFATSTNELLAGEGGDVYIGTGFNFIFAEVAVVDVDSSACKVQRTTAVGFEPDSVPTTFAYTHQYVRDVLIPEFESKATYYTDLNFPDSAAMFTARAKNWNGILAYNDSLKQIATFKQNRSFSAGAEYEYSYQTDTVKTSSITNGFAGDFSGDFGQFSFGSASNDFGVSIPIEISTERFTGATEGDTTRSLTIGYVLSDNDIGDRWTFDIKEDPVFPSPIFDVLAGASSCPWEPWPDTAGHARMVPRDGAQIVASGSQSLSGVPSDEAATFVLNLGNLSGTQETREYVLREVTVNNPGGAILRANGVPLSSGGISYFIDGNPLRNSSQVTLTVERGPTKYSYHNLAVMLYPPCEYELWEAGGALQKSDTLYLNVDFEAPCSDITLYRPESGWSYNKADTDTNATVLMVLTDYELAISETDSVNSVSGEYRKAGTNSEGPSPWVSIPADSLGNPNTFIHWTPPPSLDDGVYELRCFTHCDNGKSYSNIAVGTIDRTAPSVFGSPKPSDAELSFGEQISITFDEDIDCDALNGDIVLTYVDGPNAGDTIPTTLSCNGRTIIISPTASVNLLALEDRTLQASVDNVLDVVGNSMTSAETWSFIVKLSTFSWDPKTIITDVAFGDPGTISASLVNGSDSTANYSISSLPVWITSAAPMSGALPAGGTQSVDFTIDPGLAIGSYSGSVPVTSDRGNSTLDLFVDVICQEPTWTFDPGPYEHSMTIVAQVDIGGGLSSDPNDMVAAYVGGQLRGLTNLEQGYGGGYFAFLTVYSNQSQFIRLPGATFGESMRFEIWDDSECKLYNTALELVQFEADKTTGAPDSPFIITAIDLLPDTVQAISFNEGWNWFSVNVLAADMSVGNILSSVAPHNGDQIKSKTAFATFDAVNGWTGTLSLLDNVSSYMLKLSEPATAFVEGSTIDPSSTSVPVARNWNWIGYAPSCSLDVPTALAGIAGSLTDKDILRNQTMFAQYVAGDTWYGDLTSMASGVGYRLYLKSPGMTTGFTYATCPGPGPSPIAGAPFAGPTAQQSKGAVDVLNWSLDHSLYENNMSLIATLKFDGLDYPGGDYIVGAFVGDECRGLSQPVYLASSESYVVFMTIHMNRAGGEPITLRAFMPSTNAVYDVGETLVTQANGTIGTVQEPLALAATYAEYVTAGSLPTSYSLSQNYPNPFNAGTVIGYALTDPGEVTLEVFDVLGRRVVTLVNGFQEAGSYQINWDGRTESGERIASGVYMYRLTAGTVVATRKMVVLK